MNEDVDIRETLKSKYPRLYGPEFYFEISDEWLPFIASLSARIDTYLGDIEVETPIVGQGKEKFNQLRFYLDVLPEDTPPGVLRAIDAAIAETEDAVWGFTKFYKDLYNG